MQFIFVTLLSSVLQIYTLQDDNDVLYRIVKKLICDYGIMS